MDRLAYGMAELSGCIFYIAYDSIRRALARHLVVASKSSYTLLDCACE